MSMPSPGIPFFLTIDVETDEKLDVGPRGPASWSGVATMRRRLQDVRGRLEEVTGSEFRVGWYLRMDPQIEAICGTADHAARVFGDELHQLVESSGAYLGLHVHASRWHDDKQAWTADTHLPDVCLEHLHVGLEAYTHSMGTPPLRHKFTENVTSDDMVAALRRVGVRVDMRPAETPRLRYFERQAREPYFPRGSAVDGPCVIPATSTTLSRRYGGNIWNRMARNVRRHPYTRPPLHPYRRAQDPREYWDEVADSVRALPRPYVSIALRCEREDSWQDVRHRAVLEALVDHPFTSRLRFADPLDFTAAL